MSEHKKYTKEIKDEVKDEWFTAAKSGNYKLLRSLILSYDKSVVNIKDEVTTISSGSTALIYACINNHQRVVALLLSARADVNSACETDGSTGLMLASQYGYIDIVSLLVVAGANVNAVSKDGSTALTRAAEHGHRKVVSLLLSKGADVNARGRWGETAMTKAAAGGHDDTVNWLLSCGAEFSGSLESASNWSQTRTVSLLLSKGVVDKYSQADVQEVYTRAKTTEIKDLLQTVAK